MSYNHTWYLYQSPLMHLRDFRCRAPRAACGVETTSTVDHLLFTRRGTFVKHPRDRAAQPVTAEPVHVLLYNAGEVYHTSHPGERGDDGTVLGFDARMIRDVQRQHDPDAEDDGAAFRVDHVPAIPETALRTFRLRHRVQSGRATVLEIEEEMLGILAEVVKQCARERRLRPRRVEREPHRRRRDYAEAVKQHLAAAPERDATLEAIARHIGCSPFHLSHVFREETGLPIHQYSMRLRVAVGLDRLGEPTSLSTIGLDVGMTSHSHFSSVFRRVFGTTPSRVRQSAGISIRRRARAR